MTHGKELMVGTVIILAVVVTAAGILFMQGTNWGRTTTHVEALVRDVGQLNEGNAVKFRGVQIGRVSAVRVEPGGDAVRIGMELEGEVAIAEDAGVVIAPESMFGDWQAEIVTKSRYPRYDYFEVPRSEMVRDTIVLGGYALPDLTRLTAAADAISENVEALTDRFDRTFNEETAENLSLAIGNLQQISTDMRNLVGRASTSFDRMSGDVEVTAAEVSTAAAQARETLQEIDRIFHDGQVDSILVNLRGATGNIDVMAANMAETSEGLDATLARADSTFAGIARITRQVERGEGSLGMLLSDTMLIHRAHQVLAQLDSLLVDVQANPRRYIRLSIF
ncbi:MAG: MCE family protein [Gemmatimonadetes bacterium]|nr:MCE family protein [Gemmatimonadota bacterium]